MTASGYPVASGEPAPASAPPVPARRDAALAAAGWVAILAPVLALLLKLPSFGWFMVVIIWSSPLWILGYVLLVVAVSLGMLRRRASLREPRSRRTRSIVWAWLTSAGVVLLGLALVDGGDTSESVQSTLTMLLGVPGGSSGANDASMVVAGVGALAWIVGYVALVVEWLAALAKRQAEAPRVAPPVV
ncbi:hypothetical protein LG314_12765 [Agrococcus terreus]|uniref:hypothetical protein n=1 Tax=Agrococcus terreus TaxID=574649 RepID=UPI0038501B1C